MVRAQLREQFDRLARAARDAHAAATDPGSKAESKYDTRSLEASYLATGQARQVREMAEALQVFESLVLPDFTMDDAIDVGALVEIDLDGETRHFLLAPAAGGHELEDEGREITLLTPDSRLFGLLLGLRVGDRLSDPQLTVLEIS